MAFATVIKIILIYKKKTVHIYNIIAFKMWRFLGGL